MMIIQISSRPPMRKLLRFTALSLCFTASMYADTTFSLVNTVFSNGAVASGSISVDTSTGIVNSIDVTVVYGGTSYVFAGPPTAQGKFDNDGQYYAQSTDDASNVLLFDVPGSSLIGYSGGNLCSNAYDCDEGYTGYFSISTGPDSVNAATLATGSLAPPAAVDAPEPSFAWTHTGLPDLIGSASTVLARGMTPAYFT